MLFFSVVTWGDPVISAYCDMEISAGLQVGDVDPRVLRILRASRRLYLAVYSDTVVFVLFVFFLNFLDLEP